MILLLIVSLLALGLITFFSEEGDLGWTIVVFLVFAGFVVFIDKRVTLNEVTSYMRNNTGLLIGSAVVYVAAGISWSLMKWRWYCEWYYRIYNGGMSTLRASENKARITGWMIWWPPSLAWWLIHDPIVRFYNFLHSRLSRVFDNISVSTRDKMRK
jgi:hypothetical protein